MHHKKIDDQVGIRLCLCEAIEYLREGLLGFVAEMLNHARISTDRINRDRERTQRPRLCAKNEQICWESRTLLWAIDFYWESAFRGHWAKTCSALALLIKKAINNFYHEKPLSSDDAKNTLYNMRQLLRQAPARFGASKQAEKIESILTKINDKRPPPSPLSSLSPPLPSLKHESLRKPEAIHRAAKSGRQLSRDVRFANINKGNPGVWWLDIPVSATKRHLEISLLLYDNRNDNLRCLQIPASYFQENADGLDITPASDDRLKIRLHLSTDKNNLFVDKRGDGEIPFGQFEIH